MAKNLEGELKELDIYSLHVLVAAIDTIRECIGDDYKNTAKIYNASLKEIENRRNSR